SRACPRISSAPDLLDSVGLSGVVPQRDVTVAAAEDALHRNGTADGFARTVDTAGVRHRDHRTQQGLAGNAAPVGTFTADEFADLDPACWTRLIPDFSRGSETIQPDGKKELL